MAFPRLLSLALIASTVLASLAQQNPSQFDFRRLSSWPGYARGVVRDIQVTDGTAYMAMGDGGLCIANVKDPTQPSVIGRLDLPGLADEINVLNTLAFVACGTGGVHVINIANPAAPVRVATIESSSKVLGISTLEPKYLFVAAGPDGVKGYDLSNPAAPLLVTTFNPGGPLGTALDVDSLKFGINKNGVDYIRSLLFVAAGSSGGFVFDAADPGNLVQIASLSGYMATVSQDYWNAYFVDTSGQLIRYLDLTTISSPNFPVFGRGTLPSEVRFSDPRLKLYDGRGFVTSKSSSVPFNATYIVGASSDFPFAGRVTNVLVHSSASTRDYDYLPESYRGLSIYPIQSPTFSPVSRLLVGGTSLHVRMSGDKVFVSDREQGIQAFQFQTNKTLKHVGTYDFGATLNFDVSGNYLYRVGYIDDFNAQVLDVSDPAQPRVVANLASLIPPTAGPYILDYITVHDGRAYVSAESLDFYPSKIYTFDVSNPEAPVFLAASNASAEEMQIVGQTLFAATGGLSSYSIAPDGTLKLIQHVSDSGLPSSLKVVGNTAYLCAESQGLEIFDISDPANMQLLSTYKTTVSAQGVDVVGTNAFVANARGGFLVLDVSNPSNPTLLAQQATDNPVDDLKVVDGFIVAANGAEGVTLWKFGPGTPQTIDFPPLADATTRTDPFRLATPVASSGLPVQLSISGPATLVNGVVTITGAGVVTVRAFQAGNEIFSAASAERTFNVIEVQRIQQTIYFPEIDDPSDVDDPFDISIGISSGLPFDVAISGPATLDGSTVTINGQGEVSITVTQAGNPDFAPATLTRTFTVRDLPGAVAALVRSRNPAVADADTLPNADPDHDGLPNVVEFLLRTDPTSATSIEGHTTAFIYDSAAGVHYLKARYRKPRSSRYPMGVEVGDFAQYPNIKWVPMAAGFYNNDSGEFLLPVSAYRFPILRFVIVYP